MTDIVVRLRKYGPQSNDGYLRGPALEAAHEIERLRRDMVPASWYADANNQRNKAEADNERLREALDWALNHIGGHCTYDNVDQVVNCLETAHAALKGQP